MVETSNVIGGVSLGSNRSTRSAVNSIDSERSRRRFRNFMPCYRVDYDPRAERYFSTRTPRYLDTRTLKKIGPFLSKPVYLGFEILHRFARLRDGSFVEKEEEPLLERALAARVTRKFEARTRKRH